MASRTALERAVRALDPDAVRAQLDDDPSLVDHRDDRGRTWLHRCCAVDVTDRAGDAAAAIEIADELLRRGLDLDDAAFTEGEAFSATPLWHAVARGRNLLLVEHLLDLGCSPEWCLWAAAYHDDLAAIDLLVAHGATLDPVVDGETPLLHAVTTGRMAAAAHLADLGADVDAADERGRTALHHVVRSSRLADARTLLALGGRTDLPDASGATVAQLLARKRDPAFRALADGLDG